MKFILLSVVCLLGAAVALPAVPKQKRDILPGDPRYGTDYHLHHHHAHEHQLGSNEVEVAPALGGYVGSYNFPDNTVYQNNINFQPLSTGYGPPNFVPGKPIFTPESTGFVQKTVQHQFPAFPQQSTNFNFKTAENVGTVSNGYKAPEQPTQQTTEIPYEPAAFVPLKLQKDSAVKPQDTTSSDVSTDVETTTKDAGLNEDETNDDTLFQNGDSAQADGEADAEVQPTEKTVQPQEQVNHAHQTVQPAGNHQIQKTGAHHQNIFQQSAQQFPDFYAGLSSGNFGGSYDGFKSFDSGHQSYEVPSFGASPVATAYGSGFGNLGYGYQQDFNGNQYQGSFSSDAVHQDSTVPDFSQVSSFGSSFPQIVRFGQSQQFPQITSYSQSQQFPETTGFGQGQQFSQITGFGQGQQFPLISNFGQSQLFPQISNFDKNQQFPQISSPCQQKHDSSGVPCQLQSLFSSGFPLADQQQNNQANLQPAQKTASAKADSVRVNTGNSNQNKPTSDHLNFDDSKANSFVTQSPTKSTNSEYDY